ncbi:hypothetical protein AGDE_06787 [Angomonas deanei]|uniref:START domain containing protein, putative n=1 Tax=Angomonas deanei TaxID=59799 RepID=A0A7G2CWI0_9TRYP|nr:hypothetical protein AGDE_06787 [Angomonas deanei]CAD2222783.1 START domain containing protein, putative [Angomonas deanei]|eukprot:EPY36698.1 hypothetical protein AGDE_06787 [Angomonas deanei]
MIHDPIFRPTWDKFRVEAFEIVKLNKNNDVGYYAAKSPVPLVSNRDFVNQRMWYINKEFYKNNNSENNENNVSEEQRYEYIIFNTGVPHPMCPKNYQKIKHHEKNGTFVRATSKLTGYLIQPYYEEDNENENNISENKKNKKILGTALTYIAFADPAGWIPHSLTNYVSSKYAPNTIETMKNALILFKNEYLPEKMENGSYEKTWAYDDAHEAYLMKDFDSSVFENNNNNNNNIVTQSETVKFAQRYWREERLKKENKKILIFFLLLYI